MVLESPSRFLDCRSLVLRMPAFVEATEDDDDPPAGRTEEHADQERVASNPELEQATPEAATPVVATHIRPVEREPNLDLIENGASSGWWQAIYPPPKRRASRCIDVVLDPPRPTHAIDGRHARRTLERRFRTALHQTGSGGRRHVASLLPERGRDERI
ncbi:MAG: hypothetical protein ACR2J9_00560 [Gaiellales bacterium]